MKTKDPLSLARLNVILIISGLFIIGYISDILTYSFSTAIQIFNIISIIIVIFAGAAILLKSVSVSIASSVIVYTTFLNILLSYYVGYDMIKNFEGDILRSIVQICMIMIIAGFVAGKIHLLVLGILSNIWFISVIFTNNNEFLRSNAMIIILIIGGYTFGFYYLFHLLEVNISSKTILIDELDKRTREINESNKELMAEKDLSENQKKELKSLIETREKLFSIISHDMKNPLSAIISISDAIEISAKEGDIKHIIDYNNIIRKSCDKLYQLLLNISEWTRLQSGKLSVQPEWINVEELIGESSVLSSSSLKEKDIILQLEVGKETMIFSDKNMLSTIIRNLLSNAIKYSGRNGIIFINSGIKENRFFFSITDQGTGMNKMDIDRILKSNESFSRNGTNGEIGTGFGLLLCKEFINMHKGELIINSEPGGGSEFSFNIPVKYQPVS